MRILECENIRNGDGKGTLRASGHVLGCLWDALELQKVRQVLPNGESSIGVLQIRGPGERPRSIRRGGGPRQGPPDQGSRATLGTVCGQRLLFKEF